MQKGIHPQYHEKALVTCSCGNNFEVGSTEPELHVEVCSACHPFYSGKSKLVDQAGRVDKFKRKLADTASRAKLAKPKTKEKKTAKPKA